MRKGVHLASGVVPTRRAVLLGAVSAVVAGCSTGMGTEEAPTASITPSAGGEAVQRPPVKIALILPMEGMGETAAIAKSMKQGAELALFERNDPYVQLITKSDSGTAVGARSAANAAIAEGAEIILGPLLSDGVASAAPVARAANVPMLAFSTDHKVAGNGVYLMSFLAEQEVDRIISYAASRGKRHYAALIPEGAYGDVVEPAFRSAVKRAGGLVVVVERYPATANGMLSPAKRVMESIKQGDSELAPIDALFLPGGQEALPQIGPVIAYSGIDPRKVQLLGTGAWEFPSIGRDDAFVGGWYPSSDPQSWRSFSERFATTFGNAPPRLASVAYDAVGLAISLSTNPPGSRFTQANITRPNGFSGVDGIIRFTPDGLSERGLAVLEVQKFGSAVIDRAPTAFGPTKLSAAEHVVR